MWLPILATPIMVFWAKPQSHALWRIGRLVAAVVLLYLVLYLVLHWTNLLEQEAYRAFMQQEQDPIHPNLKDAPKITIRWRDTFAALYFGWIPALFYVSFWELIWRIQHRKEVKARQWRDSGHIFSSIFIFVSVLIFSLINVPMVQNFGFFGAILRIFGLLLILLSFLIPEPIHSVLYENGRELLRFVGQPQ